MRTYAAFASSTNMEYRTAADQSPSVAQVPNTSPAFLFLNLPKDIRLLVYDIVIFVDTPVNVRSTRDHLSGAETAEYENRIPPLSSTCKTVYNETIETLRRKPIIFDTFPLDFAAYFRHRRSPDRQPSLHNHSAFAHHILLARRFLCTPDVRWHASLSRASSDAKCARDILAHLMRPSTVTLHLPVDAERHERYPSVDKHHPWGTDGRRMPTRVDQSVRLILRLLMEGHFRTVRMVYPELYPLAGDRSDGEYSAGYEYSLDDPEEYGDIQNARKVLLPDLYRYITEQWEDSDGEHYCSEYRRNNISELPGSSEVFDPEGRYARKWDVYVTYGERIRCLDEAGTVLDVSRREETVFDMVARMRKE